MQKLPGTNELAPYSFGAKWKDGSLRTDIPTQALHTQFNVNYTIVSIPVFWTTASATN
jgi:predicted acylesterase/phospholipase RssA